MTFPEKLRYIQRYGKLTFDGKEWNFTRDPLKDCPVVNMSNTSRWCLVETVYDLIREMK